MAPAALLPAAWLLLWVAVLWAAARRLRALARLQRGALTAARVRWGWGRLEVVGVRAHRPVGLGMFVLESLSCERLPPPRPPPPRR
mmetsp:Transcript_11829/g.41101  ORF Transcript_11829/g.41101 Transcript_11829/m.41101 type:complete len:86 (+) Transcript_11829:2-259(+)